MELLGKPGPFDKALQGLEFSYCWALLMTRQPWGVTSEIHFSLLEDTACFTVLERGVHGGFWKKKQQVGVFESGKKVSPPGGVTKESMVGTGRISVPPFVPDQMLSRSSPVEIWGQTDRHPNISNPLGTRAKSNFKQP